MKTMKEHVGKMEKRLKLWGAKLDALAAEAEEAGADAKVDYGERVAELKSKYREAQSKLDELSLASNDKWTTFKHDAERAWKEFEYAFKKLTN